jgi:hypothetical protein
MLATGIGPSFFSPTLPLEEAVFDESLISDDMYKLDHLDYQKISSKKVMEELFPAGFNKDPIHFPHAFERIKQHPAYHFWKELLHPDKTDEMILAEFNLDLGTCHGQTMFMIDCIKSEPGIPSRDLIGRINWQEVFYSQMIDHISADSQRARGELGRVYLDQVQAAGFDYENSAVKASKQRRERCDEILSVLIKKEKAPVIESTQFLALETSVAQYGLELKKISKDAPALGTIRIRPYHPESSVAAHVIFFQAFPGIFRMYDPNFGMFEYPDFNTLMIGLKIFANHSRDNPQLVKFRLY